MVIILALWLAFADALPLPEVEALMAAAFPPARVQWAVRTAFCESSWRPAVVSEGFDRRLGVLYRHVGLLQIEDRLWRGLAEVYAAAMGLQTIDLRNAELNAHVGAEILQRQGPIAWPVCGRR